MSIRKTLGGLGAGGGVGVGPGGGGAAAWGYVFCIVVKQIVCDFVIASDWLFRLVSSINI